MIVEDIEETHQLAEMIYFYDRGKSDLLLMVEDLDAEMHFALMSGDGGHVDEVAASIRQVVDELIEYREFRFSFGYEPGEGPVCCARYVERDPQTAIDRLLEEFPDVEWFTILSGCRDHG